MVDSVSTPVKLAERVERISVSATFAVVHEATRLRAQGVDLVDFGPGEPDFPTPDHIKQAAVRALEENFTKYTPAAGLYLLAGVVALVMMPAAKQPLQESARRDIPSG